jgi:acetyltransferase-like isoleucine patch superfamily enzyme
MTMRSFGARATRRILLPTARRLRIAYYRALSTSWFEGSAPVLVCPALVLGPGTVRARGVVVGWRQSPGFVDGHVHFQVDRADAELVIGAGTWITNGAKFVAAGPGIEIGRNVLIGRDVEIYDSDRHETDPARRRHGTPRTGRVVIEDGVFLGAGVRVGKGVRIGRDSVVGMGSVVVGDVPPGVVAAGNPCRVIRPV